MWEWYKVGLRMASAWKHPKTGKWWYRKAVPPDLKAKHKELAAMGIKVQLYEVRHTLNASSNVDAERKWDKANEACLLRFEAVDYLTLFGTNWLLESFFGDL